MALASRTDDTRLTRGAVTGVLLAAALLAGCGSDDTPKAKPPAAGPDRSPALTAEPAGKVEQLDKIGGQLPEPIGPKATEVLREATLVITLDPKERILTVKDAATDKEVSRTNVGVGPTQVACSPDGPCFVVDTQGDALLVVRIGEGGLGTKVVRRVYLAGAPYAIAVDNKRKRLWVTLTATNQVVELPAHGRPHVLQRLPTVRQPNAITVDERSGDVYVTGDDAQSQVIPDPASPDN